MAVAVRFSTTTTTSKSRNSLHQLSVLLLSRRRSLDWRPSYYIPLLLLLPLPSFSNDKFRQQVVVVSRSPAGFGLNTAILAHHMDLRISEREREVKSSHTHATFLQPRPPSSTAANQQLRLRRGSRSRYT